MKRSEWFLIRHTCVSCLVRSSAQVRRNREQATWTVWTGRKVMPVAELDDQTTDMSVCRPKQRWLQVQSVREAESALVFHMLEGALVSDFVHLGWCSARVGCSSSLVVGRSGLQWLVGCSSLQVWCSGVVVGAPAFKFGDWLGGLVFMLSGC